MLATDIIIKNLAEVSACFDAIDSIKHDYRNSLGGLKAWNSGRTTHLKAGAKSKIEAIERRIDQLTPDGDDE